MIFRRWETYFGREESFGFGISLYISPPWEDVGRTYCVTVYFGPWKAHAGWVVRMDMWMPDPVLERDGIR